MRNILIIIFNFVHLPFKNDVVLSIGGDEVRRIRMVSYISLITMATMLSYAGVYVILDFSLFKPGIFWLLFGSIFCIIAMTLNKLGKHSFAKYLLVLLNLVFMLGSSTKIFGQSPDFQIYLLLSAFIPLFLWSIRKNTAVLIVFISISLLLYIYVEFFISTSIPLIALPEQYVENFQKTNVIACFAGAGLAIGAFMTLAYRKEDKLIAKTLELRQSQQHRDTIYSIIAHDLRSPFNGLVGVSDLLLRNFNQYDDVKKKEFVESIYETSVSLNALLENLLGWTKMQSGKIISNNEQVELKTMVDNIAKVLNDVSLRKHIEIKNTIANETVINTDNYMLSTILRNIITNAVKFTKPNGLVEVSVKLFNDKIELCIADNGIGIPEEELDGIFRPSSKYSKQGTNKEKGSGLGLRLCKDFVDALNGNIRVESKEGKGSSFYVELPN